MKTPRLAALLCALTMTAATVSPVVAGAIAPAGSPTIQLATTTGICPATDTTRVRLWENEIGDASDGNDSLWRCGNTTDLRAIDHAAPGNCQGSFLHASWTWADCVSSVTVWLPQHVALCLYGYRDYRTEWQGAGPERIAGPRYGSRLNLGRLGDDLSSFRFVPMSSAC